MGMNSLRTVIAAWLSASQISLVGVGMNDTIQYSFISAQHICSVHVMSNIVVDIYINAGLGDSY